MADAYGLANAAVASVLSKMERSFPSKKNIKMSLKVFLSRQHCFTLLWTDFDKNSIKHHSA